MSDGSRRDEAGQDTRGRYARHLNLPGVGPEGQRRLGVGQAQVQARGLAGQVARRYLEAAGVGLVNEAPGPGQGATSRAGVHPATADAVDGGADAGAWVAGAVEEPSCRAVVAGAVEALATLRGLLDGVPR